MSTELTQQGFEAQSFAQIRSEIVEAVREVLGPVNTGSESAIGQMISIIAEREALLVQALQATYASQYPASAAGRSLDGVVQLTGITRREATRTTVVVQLTGDAGTTIPEGSAAKTPNEDIFFLVEDVTLDENGEGEGQMIAQESGPILANAGAVSTIETPVSGWDSVNNEDDGTTGRPIETDPELRLRRAASLQVTGSATVNAIRSRLLEQVQGVTTARIIENRTDTVDADGRPPHSFEAVVAGGTDQDVADLIFEAKPAGIETTGTETLIVQDSEGIDQVIEFTRPIQRYIWVKVTLDPNGIGTFPDNAESLAADAVLEKGDSLSLGNDVIYQSFYGPVFRAVDGLEEITVTVAASSDPNTEPASGDFAEQNITIESNELALFDADRIEVTTV